MKRVNVRDKPRVFTQAEKDTFIELTDQERDFRLAGPARIDRKEWDETTALALEIGGVNPRQIAAITSLAMLEAITWE